jgi:cellobiose transport system permease protein
MTDVAQGSLAGLGRLRAHRRRPVAGGAAGEPSGLLTRYPVLVLIVLLSSFPVYWTFTIASQTNEAIGQTPPPFVPGGHFLANARRVFDTVDFAKALVNSFIVAGSMAGFAFAKLRFHGRNALLLVVIATMMCPVQLGVIPLYIEMRALGWAQHLLAVIVPTAVTGFGVVFMRQYTVQAVPDELLEAGRMDGCSSWGLYWYIVLPALRPAMAVLGLLTFMQAWNDFMWPVIVLSPQNPTVQVAISTLAAGQYMDYTLVLAGTALSTLPILIVFGLFGRRIIGGVMEGAVKG